MKKTLLYFGHLSYNKMNIDEHKKKPLLLLKPLKLINYLLKNFMRYLSIEKSFNYLKK